MKVYGARFANNTVTARFPELADGERLHLQDLPLASSWSPLDIQLEWTEEYTGQQRLEVDIFPVDTDHLCLNARAVQLIGDLFTAAGELLPVTADGEPYWVYHQVGPESAIDLSGTLVRYRGEVVPLVDVPRDHWRPRPLQQVRFQPERVASTPVFGAIGLSPWSCFFSQAAAARLLQLEVTGLTIEVVWEDDSFSDALDPSSLPERTVAGVWPRFIGLATPLYKVLVNDRSPVTPSFRWPLPSDTRPGGWVTCEGPLDPGHHGLHLFTTDPYLTWPHWGMRVYLAECGPNAVMGHGVVVSDRVRLLAEVEPPSWWTEGVQFIEHELAAASWYEPHLPPLPNWHVCTLLESDQQDAARAQAKALGFDVEPVLDLRELTELIVATGRRHAARLFWGTAWSRTAATTREAGITGRNRDLIASNETLADLAADLCMLRSVLSDVEVRPDFRELLEAMWDVYSRGYVPEGFANDGRIFVVTMATDSKAR